MQGLTEIGGDQGADDPKNGGQDEPARLIAFINTIVRHQINAAIRNVARARNRQFDIKEQWGLADSAPGPETAHLAFEQRKLLCALLQTS